MGVPVGVPAGSRTILNLKRQLSISRRDTITPSGRGLGQRLTPPAATAARPGTSTPLGRVQPNDALSPDPVVDVASTTRGYHRDTVSAIIGALGGRAAEGAKKGGRSVAVQSGQPEVPLSDVPEPQSIHVLTVAGRVHGPPISPKQRISFYAPDDWEEFVREWARSLREKYDQVKRMGGANDHGADVAAFLTPQHFEGEWDCYQCKHYKDVLQPSDAWPEILKVLKSVVLGHYCMPRRYVFVTPVGCSGSLEKLLSAPSKLRTQFLEQFSKAKNPLGADMEPGLLAAVRALAASLDFSLFKSADINEVLEDHKRTPYFAMRFGGPLPARPPVESPPDSPTTQEARYVAHLLRVYAEHFGPEASDLDGVAGNPKAASHLRRQREAFYSAESLERFARDAVPPGTYEQLQGDVYHGVIEVHTADHLSGMARLTEVLKAVVSLNLPSNALIETSDSRDRKGICHQLANVDRLIWCDGE